MRELPLGHPGLPDLRSPARFLLWVARGQLGTLALGIAYGVVWMGALAVVPALVGRAIDQGVAEGDRAALVAGRPGHGGRAGHRRRRDPSSPRRLATG